ncbi:MAG: DUF2878 domain-containing protein [Dokdonella sp.]|uniref:DUF2878 domain-containing protein n=1 Tax=Dokdonella sp. TaxID=2291710 RepID=UPI003F7F92ED
MGMLANILGYQCVWFIAVFGAAHASAWPAVAAASAFALVQITISRRRRGDVYAMAIAVAAGVAIDGMLAHAGLVAYATPSPALAAPLWILAIWAAFGLTLGHSLAFLQRRPWLAALLGAVGAPLAYLAAARIAAVRPGATGLFAIAVAWALVLPLLCRLARQAGEDTEALA